MSDFVFQELFPLGEDATPYRKLTADHVGAASLRGESVVTVAPAALTLLAQQAFADCAHLLRPGHLKQLRRILDDPEASPNDRFVAFDLMKNANIAAGRVLPMCQDTGTAIVMGKKGQRVWTGGGDAAALSAGHPAHLHRDQSALQPAGAAQHVQGGQYRRQSAGADRPLCRRGRRIQIPVHRQGRRLGEQDLPLSSRPRRCSNPDALLKFLDEKIRTLGTSACPPYHLAIVIGGTSAEMNLKTVKLASCRYLDSLPAEGNKAGQAFRDRAFEQEVLGLTRAMGIGAQFGGKYFCHDVRVVRLPRHGASVPIGIGVSCAADRQILGKINAKGVFLEELETNPAQYLPEIDEEKLGGEVVRIDLNRPMSEIRATLSRYPIKTRLALDGPLIVARDIAHAKLKERLDRGEGLPQYMKDRAIYYAGPAKTPAGLASGSFGPTTAGRMDSYVDQFMAAGGSFVTLAKGNRGPEVREACRKHGGFYLGSIGGSRRAACPGLHQERRGGGVSRTRHGGDLANRGGRLPGLHRHRRQGQRFLRQARMSGLADGGSGA